MVKVKVLRTNNVIKTITVYDHANYAEHGKDLVCAGVSSIVVGMLNALDEFYPDSCLLEMKQGFIEIQVVKSCENQLLLEAMLVQIKTMQHSYPKYIKIIAQEV